MHWLSRWNSAGLALAFLLLPISVAAAQETGTVQGTVLSVDGQAVFGAAVSVEGTRIGTLAIEGGAYTLFDVPAGTQTIRVSVIGYSPQSAEVTVPAAGTVTADFTLEVDALNLEALVVTGTATETRKVEATYSVTNLSDIQITEKAPQSTAELLEVVPGFYVESSGGQGGNNVWARGIPQDGGTDETVRTLEAVRGGSASIFASNAPGGIINFVSKTGGEELAGVAKLTLGDYSLVRTDLNYGGPLGEDWRFNVGGFYRFDRGVRDPGFPANRGGQLKLNLTRLLDNGYVRVNARYMNDRNIFYLPVPLQNPDDPTDIPGFDANYGTLTSNDVARVKIPTPVPVAGGGNTGISGILDLNLKEGMHPVYQSVGAEGYFDLGNGWSVKDAFRRMTADVQFNAIFSVFNPVDATTFGEDKAAELGGADFRYSYTNSDATFNPSSANGNGLVVASGWWTVTKPLSNFVNNFQISKQSLGEIDNEFTLGFYFSNYSADEFWLFNNVLQEVRDAPRLLELDILDAGGDVLTKATNNGFTKYGDLYVNHSGDVNLYALYAQDTWKPDEHWTIDIGGRYEFMDVNGSVENVEEFDLGLEGTVVGSSMDFGNGSFRAYDWDFDDVAYSLGVGYMFNDQVGVFGRWTDGFRMPDFEQWIFSSEQGEIEDVKQAEVGFKYGSPTLGVFATGFWSQLTDVQFSDEVLVDGDLVTALRFADTQNIGAETEIVWVPTPAFEASWTGTIQNPELTSLRLDPSFPGTLPPELDFDGNQIRRLPKIISAFKLSYRFPARAGNLKLWGTWGYIDDRFVDDANNVTLPSYSRFDAGLSFDISPRVSVLIAGNNLTNSIGLTEGNPRVGQVVGSTQDIFLARPILGANGRASISYAF
jgi:outer membrane receptor protein involved in Fe transport